MKIVFLGTPQIAVPSLQYFIEKQNIEVLAVITQPDRPSGRGKKLTPPPVKVLAQENNLDVYQPLSIKKDEELISKLKDMHADVFITVAFGQILSQEVLDIPRLGVINLHASLLPKYRGPNPIQWAIINGDKVTGVTTMLSTIGVDEGPMLIKKEIEIDNNMNSEQLAQEISTIGPQVLYDSIIGLNNKSITPEPQVHENATYAKKLKKDDSAINWTEDSITIHNKIRGMHPWPGTYTLIGDLKVKIIESEVKNKENVKNADPGEIVGIIKSGVEVATGDSILVVKQVHPPGKKVMDAASWCNGARINTGDKFQ